MKLNAENIGKKIKSQQWSDQLVLLDRTKLIIKSAEVEIIGTLLFVGRDCPYWATSI